ncbi:MAG: ATP-binding protein [archaeon]
MPEQLKSEELISEGKLFFETYKKDIGDSIRKGRKTVFVSFEDLASNSPTLAEALIYSPEEVLQILEVALEESGLIKTPRIRFKDLPETQKVKIRTVRAQHLNKFIFFEGLVRQASEVRPQVVNARFECPSCGTVISVLQIEKKFREPSRCSCGRKGQFRLISKTMVDAQRLVIEESPESLVGGEQPRRINVFLKEDLVEPNMEEKTTPGSKVRVLGILKEVPVPLPSGAISTRFDLAIEANNLIPLETTYEELDISEEDERQIQELAEDPELFKKLTESIAPSIYGYSEIKQALVLQMFSGVRKTSEDGTVSRGDIHLFLIGDPGVAKSVTLKFISNIAPRGRYIVGKSASGAGITATVVRDEFLKGWSLEAGAMVLANKGVVCIDEIEKMDANDRSAMHEALEQQTVTISKANVQACYSEDTEVLTEKGWKKYIDVKKLKIAQFDPKTKTIQFLPHKGLFIYDYNRKMFNFKNKRNDILVTPNHKMLVREERHKNYQEINAEDIPYKRVKVLNSGDYINKNPIKHFILPPIKHKQNRIHPKYTNQHKPKKIPINLWLEFLGYYLTEGGTETKPTIGITQKDKKNINKIKNCLLKLSEHVRFKLTEIKKQDYTKLKITNTQLFEYLKKLGKKSYIKKFPLEDIPLSDLSKEQINILYKSMMLGDGSKYEKSYGSTSKELIDTFQAIACLNKKSANNQLHYKGKSRGNRKDMYRVSLSDKIELCLRKDCNNIKKVNYKGKVFCFSTKTGFFITRRNGKIAIQGNTLSAQTSVLAAGNPKYGRFEPLQSVTEQIDLPPALINRFDLIFVLRDLPNASQDDAIATHVLNLHQMKEKKPDIDANLFKKYVAFAKQKIEPKLTEEAVNEIKNFYLKMRKASIEGESRSIAISARQLQGLVRLAEAHAKTRLSSTVDQIDSQVAIRLTNYYLMQVGYDPDTKTFDIDRFTNKISSSQRSKIILLRESIKKLEEKHGKQVPLDILRNEMKDLSDSEFEEAMEKLKKSGDIFQPKKGFVQDVQSR